jgi:hypothetical protein
MSGRTLVALIRLQRLDRGFELDHGLRCVPHALEMGVELRSDDGIANHEQIVVLLALAAGAEIRRAGARDLTNMPSGA